MPLATVDAMDELCATLFLCAVRAEVNYFTHRCSLFFPSRKKSKGFPSNSLLLAFPNGIQTAVVG